MPVFEHPAFQAPAYAPPCAPRPIGFLAGYAPLLMLDMSGTMHPSKGGRFFDMKVVSTLFHLLLLLLNLVVSILVADTTLIMQTCEISGDCDGTCCQQS